MAPMRNLIIKSFHYVCMWEDIHCSTISKPRLSKLWTFSMEQNMYGSSVSFWAEHSSIARYPKHIHMFTRVDAGFCEQKAYFIMIIIIAQKGLHNCSHWGFHCANSFTSVSTSQEMAQWMNSILAHWPVPRPCYHTNRSWGITPW